MLLLLSKEDYWFLAFYPVLNSLTFLRIFWKFWGKEIHTALRFSKYQRSPQWRQLIKKLSIICYISEHGKAWFMYLTLWRLELACPDDDYDLGGTLSRNGPFRGVRSPEANPCWACPHPPVSTQNDSVSCGDLSPTLRILDGTVAWFPQGLWTLLSLEWCRLSLFLAVSPGSCSGRPCAS